MIIINLELIQIKQLKKRITQYLPEVMVLVGFVLYYLSQFKYTTMFQFPFTMIKIVKYSGLLLIALKVIIFDRKKYKIVYVFAVIFINSMIAHHYLEIAYNFMIPLLLCDLDDKGELVNKKKKAI